MDSYIDSAGQRRYRRHNNHPAAVVSAAAAPSAHAAPTISMARQSVSPSRDTGARGSNDPAPPIVRGPARPLVASSSSPLRVAVKGIGKESSEITITGFHENELTFTRLESAAQSHIMVQIEQSLNDFHATRVKVEIIWNVLNRDGEEHDWHMSLNVIEIVPAPRGMSQVEHFRHLLDKIDERVRDMMERAKMRETGTVFLGMKFVKLSMIRGKRARLLGPPPAPVEAAHGSAGAGSCKTSVPADLRLRRCCLNIDNKDQYCFRYALTAWRVPSIDRKNAGRANQYITNAPAGGPKPRFFVPEFVESGLNFDMLEYPVKIGDIQGFEDVNDIGIYVFEWHGGMAIPVRRPEIARKPENEVCLLLHEEHWMLVTAPHNLLHGPLQKDQFFCYRCQKVFWHNFEKLKQHLSSVSPKSCLEVPDDVKTYRLPPPEKSVLKFTHFEKVLHHPLVVYADFETFQVAIDDDLKKFTRMTGVASFGYFVHSRIPQIPSGVRLVRGTAMTFLQELVALGIQYRKLAQKPVPITWNADLQDEFEATDHCYLCGRTMNERLRDHDHFTGEYRGAICKSCNRKAAVPKQLIIFFHNLETFDGHYIIKGISKLVKTAAAGDVDGNVAGNDQPEEESLSESDSDPDSEPDSNPGSDPDSDPDDNDDDVAVDYSSLRYTTIGNTREKYMQIVYGPLCFRDSFRFNACGLGSWIESQRSLMPTLAESFPILRQFHPFVGANGMGVEESLNLLLQKVPMSYKSITSQDYFNLPAILDRDAYDDDLNDKKCTEEAYAMVQRVVEAFGLKNQGEYHDMYLFTDVLALADVMTAMRTTWHNRFGLDMAHYVTLASSSYDSMLKMTNAKIELIHDENGGKEFMDKINANIRGGICCIFQPHALANNWTALPSELPPVLAEFEVLHDAVRNHHALLGQQQQLPQQYKEWMRANGYNPDEPTTWLVYADANSLYPTVMTSALPQRAYNKLELPETTINRLELANTLLKNYRSNHRTGYFIEVSYHVPHELHDFFDYAPIAKRAVDISELSEYQRDMFEKNGRNIKSEKLFPFLGEQRNMMHHIELLQFWIELGVKVTEVHSIYSFQQTRWMSSYVNTLTAVRRDSKDPIEKQVCKIAMNSLYGKTCQDKMNQRSLTPHNNLDKFEKAASKAVDFTIMYNDDDEGLFALTVPERRQGPIINTPRPVAFAILELSKLVVLKAHYCFFKQLKSKLLFTDTDSLAYLVEIINLLAVLLDSAQVSFDLSATIKSEEEMRDILRSTCSQDVLEDRVKLAMEKLRSNKGKLGAFKLESERNCLMEFVGLAPKMYSFKVMHEDGTIDAYMKGKGVPRQVLKAQVKHEDYRRMLFTPYDSVANFRKLQSSNHEICGLQMSKRMLTAMQDKTYQTGPTESRPLGHYLNHNVDDDPDL